ncbi:MAG: hypothetical protein DWQ10_05825 [Calditrichaeota bacterium]|nr:MAG: hypothetical protein DWQ10_05825 [Calditrichota bacterium]
MKKVIKSLKFIFFFILALQVAGLTAGEKKGAKKRIAVFEFDDKTDHRVLWWTGQGPGRGMADMLITELVKGGNYTVIERTALDKILAEQNLGKSGLVTPQTAAQTGKLLGVDIAVIGAVTEFGHSKGDVGGSAKGIGVGVSSQTVTVAVDVRFVNTTTGEILAAENIRRDKKKRGLSFRKQGLSFNNRNKFDQSLIGKATRDAIEDIMKLLDDKSASLVWQGKIVKADASSVIINAGAEAGLKVGDELVVYRKGEELIDPDTGISLGATEAKVGKIKVTDNSIGKGKASRCSIVSGSGYQRGDVVKEK